MTLESFQAERGLTVWIEALHEFMERRSALPATT